MRKKNRRCLSRCCFWSENQSNREGERETKVFFLLFFTRQCSLTLTSSFYLFIFCSTCLGLLNSINNLVILVSLPRSWSNKLFFTFSFFFISNNKFTSARFSQSMHLEKWSFPPLLHPPPPLYFLGFEMTHRNFLTDCMTFLYQTTTDAKSNCSSILEYWPE